MANYHTAPPTNLVKTQDRTTTPNIQAREDLEKGLGITLFRSREKSWESAVGVPGLICHD